MPCLLDIRGLTKRYAGVTALDRVDLKAEAGEVHAIVGANGAGKSTLMNLLSGAETASAGEISLDGTPVRLTSPSQAQALGVATVYQEFTLVPQLSVARNIYLGKEPRTGLGLVDHRRLLRKTQELLQRFGINLAPDTPVATLSVADQQLVEIVRALSVRARILILDEPTAVLSLREQENLFTIMRRLRDEGMLILFVSHRLEEVQEIADRVTAIRDGKKIGTKPVAGLTRAEIVRMMIGKDTGPKARTAQVPDGAKQFEIIYHTARSAQNLKLGRGEILGLAGLVGAGRSSFARALIGQGYPGSTATLTRHGTPLANATPRRALRAGVIYLTEDRKADGIFRGLDIIANTSAVALPSFARMGTRNGRAETRAARAMLSDLKLVAARLDMPVEQLSGGNQQKVVMARALLGQPRLLIIDEPTRGVDVGAKGEIHDIIAGLAANGASIIVISSEIEELLALTHRIAVMKDHRFVAEMPTAASSKTDILMAASGTEQERTPP